MKINLISTISGILLVLVILLTYSAWKSDQNYKKQICQFPIIDQFGNAIYPEECNNSDTINTSKNWGALGNRILAIIFVLISLSLWLFQKYKEKRIISKTI